MKGFKILGIILGIMIFLILAVASIDFDETEKTEKESKIEKAEKTEVTKKTKNESTLTNKPEKNESKNPLIISLQEKPLMNGANSEKIGTYGITNISKKLLSDKILLDFDKNIKNRNLKYILIDFGDGTGFHVIDNIYTHCKLGKNNNGILENQGSLGNDVFVYSDENKVEWGKFKK